MAKINPIKIEGTAMQKKGGATTIISRFIRNIFIYFLASSAIGVVDNLVASFAYEMPEVLSTVSIATVICRVVLNLWFLSIVVRLIFGLAGVVADSSPGDEGKLFTKKRDPEAWRNTFNHIQVKSVQNKEPEYTSDIERKQACREKELERKFGLR